MATDDNVQRDPRVDPRPGDVVKRAYGVRWKTRIVTKRRGVTIIYVRHLGSETICCCGLSIWQQWCAHPEVQVVARNERVEDQVPTRNLLIPNSEAEIEDGQIGP